MKIIMIPLSRITTNPDQPRKIFNDNEISELSQSIKKYGVLQPIIVRRGSKGSFIVVAGERRLRAAKLAGLLTIPSVIKDLENRETAIISLIENVQRAELNYMEEAKAYKSLMDEYDLTQGEIAENVNKRQSTISNKIRILSLPEDIQQLLLENALSERHARALLRLKEDDERKRVIKRVIDNGLNVNQTEKIIDEIIKSTDELSRKQKRVGYISYKIYVNTLKNAFKQIKEMEKNAKYIETEQDEYCEVKIIIPKKERCFT